jgi:glycosyltransferase involved in cell wall biosynthesis
LYIKETILSLKAQTFPISEIIVVDDGSTDDSVKIAKEHDCRVISFDYSLGRGHARMVGINESKSDFVLFCDSSNIIKADFLELALKVFNDVKVSACFGRIVNHEKLTDRLSLWRGRHLFNQEKPYKKEIHNVQCLITYAVLMRKNHVISVGNFNPKHKQCEDQELGVKLLQNKYKIISIPELTTYSIRNESYRSLCSRFSRWQSSYKERNNPYKQFLNNLRICTLIFCREDFKNNDLFSFLISFCMPFSVFISTLFSKEQKFH